MSNIVLDAIFQRRSVRAYTSERVSDEMVETLAKTALASPSAMNGQPWHVIAVQNNEFILELERAVIAYFVKTGNTAMVERCKSRGDKIFYDSSTVFFITAKNAASAKLDIGIVAENLSIAATGMGLGSIILGLPRFPLEDPDTAEYWKKKLCFPEGFDFGIAIAVGYSANEGAPHEIDMSKLSYVK